jgi:hypothetical protein
MAYQDNGGARAPRQMFDISAMNITCSECGTPITELPFEPTKKEDGTLGKLFCYECNKKRNADKPRRGGFGGGNGGFGGRRF